MEVGVVLGWLVGLDTRARAAWFCGCPRRAAALLALFFATPPALSALNGVSSLQLSLGTGVGAGAGWAPPALAAFSALAGAVFAAVFAHVRHARATLPRPAFHAYTASRFAICAAYCLAIGTTAAAFAARTELRNVHLHHHFVALVIGSFASFDRAPSAALLAVCAGVLVQGVGAYGFEPLLTDAGCASVRMTTTLAHSLADAGGCRWDAGIAARAQTLSFMLCPSDAVALDAALYGHCGGATT
jgi:hypothetical protein